MSSPHGTKPQPNQPPLGDDARGGGSHRRKALSRRRPVSLAIAASLLAVSVFPGNARATATVDGDKLLVPIASVPIDIMLLSVDAARAAEGRTLSRFYAVSEVLVTVPQVVLFSVWLSGEHPLPWRDGLLGGALIALPAGLAVHGIHALSSAGPTPSSRNWALAPTFGVGTMGTGRGPRQTSSGLVVAGRF